MTTLTTIATARPVRVDQLAAELGAMVGVIADGEITEVTAAVDLSTLEAALAVHVPDPGWHPVIETSPTPIDAWLAGQPPESSEVLIGVMRGLVAVATANGLDAAQMEELIPMVFAQAIGIGE